VNEEFREMVGDALRLLVDNDNEGKNYIAANWILISEWADFEGNRFLHTEVSESMTPWNAAGMMRLAEEYNSELEDAFPMEEEDE
jgi:hypothetical protein